ncbi:glycosyltransferase [Yeosuana sp. AK3]
MIEDKNIICISQTTWHGEFTKSTVQLLSLLAKKNNVFFVEYPFTLKDVVMSILGKQRAQVSRMLGFKKRIQKVKIPNGASVNHIVMPPVLPVDFISNESLFKCFFKINVWIYKNQLKKVIKKYNLDKPIIITAYNPVYGLPMIGRLNEFLNIYYCYDGVDTQRHKSRIYDIEKQFCEKVDGIITTSDYLNSEKMILNKHSHVVKNGVDFSLFVPHAKTTVSELKAIKKVGYIGTLDFRFDIDIMEYTIKKLPQVIFEFTGYLLNHEIVERLSKYINVSFFGSVKAEEVPELLAKYDLGIIPYKMNDVNKNIYPLKINEYLAVGVPVVMTAFANLTDFDAMVKSANTKEQFKLHIVQALKEDDDLEIKKRIKFAKQNSWEGRAVEFENILDNFIKVKENQ